MAEEYKHCHCFALFSRKETFGIAYREAMAAGRPVIAVKNGGIEADWDDRNGIIVDDISLLSSALKRAKEDYAAFDGEEISRHCREKYAPEAVIGQLERLLATAAEKVAES
jgi:glycosyltransferase involved in cell wall biosynthesis